MTTNSMHQELGLPEPKPSIPGAIVPTLERAAQQALALLSVQRAIGLQRGDGEKLSIIEDACWALQSALEGYKDERIESLAPLRTQEGMTVAMLSGMVATPTMRNCAHAHGAVTLAAFASVEAQFEAAKAQALVATTAQN